MGKDEFGEHSKKSDNGDDRPFKKAKYVWQLKGKYHLKEQENDFEETKNDSSNENVKEIKAESTTSSNNNGSTISENCSKCIDTLLAHSNSLLENEDASDPEILYNYMDRPIIEFPALLAKPRPKPKNHDEYLLKWQARQVAKSFIDNTINNILEQWKMPHKEFDDLVENCDSGGQIEDEGILMAIQSHGLQSDANYNELYENNAPSRGETSQSGNDINMSVDKIPPVSSSSSQIDESMLDKVENVHNETMKENESDADMPCGSDNFGDQMDFLDTAVSVAIQKKGLSSYNYG